MKWSKKENDVSGENLGIYIKEIMTNYRLIISRRVVGKFFNPWEFTQKFSDYLPRDLSPTLVGEMFFAV